jgi:hypothetical protein
MPLVNGTRDTVAFAASDSRLAIVREALDTTGGWRPVEFLPSSWCGNSYHRVFLGPTEYWEFDAPVMTGIAETRFRFVLTLGHTQVYSNEFPGRLNPEQFDRQEAHRARGLMDPYGDASGSAPLGSEH